MRRDVAIVVRGFTADPETGRPVPNVPGSWEVVTGVDGFCEVYPQGRSNPNVWFHALLCTNPPSPGAWAIWGPRAVIQQLIDMVAISWDTVAALRADGGANATAVKAAWNAGTATTVRKRVAGYLDDDGEAQP